ncbi:hypothetical protein CC79DRAFT_862096 [Sarocladium strictum]
MGRAATDASCLSVRKHGIMYIATRINKSSAEHLHRRGLSTGGSIGLIIGLSSLLTIIAVAACAMSRRSSYAKRRHRRSRSRSDRKEHSHRRTQQQQSHHSHEHKQHHVQNVNIQPPNSTYAHRGQNRPAEGWPNFPAPWAWNGPNMNVNLGDDPSFWRRYSFGDFIRPRSPDRYPDWSERGRSENSRSRSTRDKRSRSTDRREPYMYADKLSWPRTPFYGPPQYSWAPSRYQHSYGRPDSQQPGPYNAPTHPQYWQHGQPHPYDRPY